MKGISESDSPKSSSRKEKRTNVATAASAASVRAIGSQALAFYFRAPAKAFFRSRIDYLAFARAINPHFQANEGYSLRISTPGLLSHAVKTYGWSFIPNHVLPPMLANIGIGAVLYTSYLQFLGKLHPPSSRSLKYVYPPPAIYATFTAGFAAGAISSVVAAPLDALAFRFKTSEILSGRYRTTWQYGYKKLHEIGPRGIFAGWSLAFIKDSLGYGTFFATFEYVKAQAYHRFINTYYGSNLHTQSTPSKLESQHLNDNPLINIKPHWTLPALFLLLAGISASITQQIIQHPISIIQTVHAKFLLTTNNNPNPNHQTQTRHPQNPRPPMPLKKYISLYRTTFQQCKIYARRAGGWRRWMYRGFVANTITQVPSTSAGLVIFELVRRRYGDDVDMDGDVDADAMVV